MFLAAAGTAVAADRSNQEAGYFENTRTVLQMDCAAPRKGDFAARMIDRELSRIFRYPYYRKLDVPARRGQVLSSGELRAAAVEAGADIVVQPEVVRFDQFRQMPIFLLDADPLITTAAHIRLTYWEEGMDQAVTVETSYFHTDEEGPDTDEAYIADLMWKRLMKKFPYRRVPADRSANLTGPVETAAATR